LGGLAFLLILWRKVNRPKELDAEHPTWILADFRTDELEGLAVQVAAEIPDDAEAVAAIRAGDGKPKEWKVAAASMRSHARTWEDRTRLRAARLLKAAADGGLPVPPDADQEALFQAVDRLKALPLDEAFAVLASEVSALGALERKLVTLRSEPSWQNMDARLRWREIFHEVRQLVGPLAPAGSPLIRTEEALSVVLVLAKRTAGVEES